MEDFTEVNRELSECLSLCASGDKAAFETIYTLTSPKLNAIILGMVRDQQLTHDILQNAYLSIWKNAASFDPEKGKAFTWMLVITRNRALDVLRKRKRQGATELLPEVLIDENMQSDDGAKAMLLRRLIMPYLQSLDPKVSKAIIMSAVHGMSSREIGELIGVPTNTVKSWVRRGLAKIKKDSGVQNLESLI